MQYWTYKNWGAVIGFLIVFSSVIIGVGFTALGILIGIVGYFVGRFLDGDLDLQEIRDRAQGRTRYPAERYPEQEPRQGPPRVQ